MILGYNNILPAAVPGSWSIVSSQTMVNRTLISHGATQVLSQMVYLGMGTWLEKYVTHFACYLVLWCGLYLVGLKHAILPVVYILDINISHIGRILKYILTWCFMTKANYTAYTFYIFNANTFYKPMQFSLYHDLEKESSSKSVGLSEYFFFTNPKAFSEIFFCLINSIISLTFHQPPIMVAWHTLYDHWGIPWHSVI